MLRLLPRHREKQRDEAIQKNITIKPDCVTAFAMTGLIALQFHNLTTKKHYIIPARYDILKAL